MTDAADGAREVPVGLGEAEAVEERHRPRAHRDDVAEDPTDARGGALERLDRGGVVVALDLERDREPVAEVEHAGVLARPLEHARAARGQPLQEERRVLVPAVLRPEEREDRELEVVRVAPEQRADSLELPVGEAECAMERRIRHAGQKISLSTASDPHGGDRRTGSLSACARYWPLILLLAAMWGASYLFIKLAVEDIPPAAMTELRVLLAGVLLFAYLAWRMGASRAVAELRAAWVPCLVLGVINAAIPMGLVAWGETHIESSVAGIAQATVPIFTFLLAARFLPHERVGGDAHRRRRARLPRCRGARRARHRRRVVGHRGHVRGRPLVALVRRGRRLRAAPDTGRPGARPRDGEHARGRARARFRSPSSTHRARCPARRAIAGLVGLILIPTFAGQLLLFRVLRLHGSRKLSIVTYLMPAFAVAYGALLLDEPVTTAMLAGFALIAIGAAFASGQRFFGVRAQETPA